MAEDGSYKIMQMVEDGYRYLFEKKLDKVFGQAIYMNRRDQGESVTESFNTKTAAFNMLRSRGADLTEGSAGQLLMGHALLKYAFLAVEQRQKILVGDPGEHRGEQNGVSIKYWR